MDNEKIWLQPKDDAFLINEKQEVTRLHRERDSFKFQKWKQGPAPVNNDTTLLPPYKKRNKSK